MANTFSPFGFKSFGHREGSPPTMGLERKFIASSDANPYFTGDPVSLNHTYITPPASGTTQIYGIFVGCEFFNASVGRVVWSSFFPAAGTVSSGLGDAFAYVISDPEQTFLVQTSSALAILSSQVGLNIGHSVAASSLGNQTTGISNVTALSTSAATSSSLPFTIVGLYADYFAPNGIQGLTAGAFSFGNANGMDNSAGGNYIVVSPNNWTRRAGTVGV